MPPDSIQPVKFNVTTLDLLASLRSETCPACGSHKQSRHTLCGTCYRELPQPKRQALYDVVGQGYEQAVEAALIHLSAPVFIKPI